MPSTHASSTQPRRPTGPGLIAIRSDERGFGIRYGMSEAEDAVHSGPTFATLPEALAWIDALDRLRGREG